MAKINIKEHPELRHALAHMFYAIRSLVEGHPAEADFELDSVEGLVFWEDDDHMTRAIEGKSMKKCTKKRKKSCKGKRNCKGKKK